MLSSAKKAYRTNFLEYKITGDQKYKVAADAALASINKVISDLENTPSPDPPPDFEHLMRDSTIRLKNGRRKLIEEKDALVEAKMRMPALPLTSLDWRYYVIGVLLVAALAVRA
jgi:hypothetical protein